jgi:hypothetical protein
MTKRAPRSFSNRAIQQGAIVLVESVVRFLRDNNIPKNLILTSARLLDNPAKPGGGVRLYRELVRAYEDMGLVMSAWFSLPKFLDREGRPLPLSASSGPRSVGSLIRSSHVKISVSLASELLRRSTSVKIDSRGNFVALKRVFVLPEFEVPRAALVIERYLDTLRKNSSAEKNGTNLLLERNCHVPEMDLRRIRPILRDIKGRGTAFMDSVDGDIEAHRIRRTRRKGVGELGVLVFAWTRPSKSRQSKANPRAST